MNLFFVNSDDNKYKNVLQQYKQLGYVSRIRNGVITWRSGSQSPNGDQWRFRGKAPSLWRQEVRERSPHLLLGVLIFFNKNIAF